MRGRAVDENGKPLEGVSVAIAPRETFITAAVIATPLLRTDARGRFELAIGDPGLPPHERVPILAAAGRATVIVQPDEAWGTTRALDLGDVVLPPAMTLRGQVRTVGGGPVAGARIVAVDRMSALTSNPWRFQTRGLCSSATTSGGDGAFELAGVVTGAAQVAVEAVGHYRLVVPFVDVGRPLAVELTRGGFVEGLVTDGTGSPVPFAYLWLHFVAGHRTWSARAGADGRFALTLPFPHRYRLRASTCAGDVAEWNPTGVEYVPFGTLWDGPAKGVELCIGAAAAARRTLLVHAVDAETGKAVEEVQAATFWHHPEWLENWPLNRLEFEARALRRRGPGEFRLPGPAATEPETGLLLLVAVGHAPLALPVAWVEPGPLQVEAKLTRAATLAGVVIDAKSRTPIAGALVEFDDSDNPMRWAKRADPTARAPGRAVTDAAGRFRLDGLRAGTYAVHAQHRQRPRGEPVAVKLGAGEARAGLVLELAPTHSLSGKLEGTQAGTGWEARLIYNGRDIERWGIRGDNGPDVPAQRSPVAADGTFTFPAVVAGAYFLELLIPHHRGRNGYAGVVLASRLRMPTTDLHREFDVRGAVPGSIRGTLTIAGARMQPGRLLATVFVPSGTNVDFPDRPYLLEPVAADGSFTLPAPPGEQRVEILDLATGVSLAVANGVQVASEATTTLALHLELVPVQVRLVAAKDAAVEAAYLSILVQHDRLGLEAGSVGAVDLAGQTRELELLLPPVATTLAVYSNHGWVHEDTLGSTLLGESKITPQKARPNRVEIAVRTPLRPAGK